MPTIEFAGYCIEYDRKCGQVSTSAVASASFAAHAPATSRLSFLLPSLTSPLSCEAYLREKIDQVVDAISADSAVLLSPLVAATELRSTIGAAGADAAAVSISWP